MIFAIEIVLKTLWDKYLVAIVEHDVLSEVECSDCHSEINRSGLMYCCYHARQNEAHRNKRATETTF